MKYIHKRQAGFGLIEIILLILFLLLILFILWYVFFKNGSQTPGNSDQAPNEQVQQEPDPRAGWKEYCSPVETSCFKYPADWTLQDDPNNISDDGEFKRVTSPAGSAVNWASVVTGVGGACDIETEPPVYIKSATAVPNINNTFAVQLTKGNVAEVHSMGLVNGTAGQAPSLGSTGDCIYFELFQSKDGVHQMWLSTGTLQQQDVATVELILTSFHY